MLTYFIGEGADIRKVRISADVVSEPSAYLIHRQISV